MHLLTNNDMCVLIILQLVLKYRPPEEFLSLADQCPEADGDWNYYEYACQCGSCQSTDLGNVENLYDANFKTRHHKNIKNIIALLEPPATSLNATVAFIGHVTCENAGDAHGESAVRGLSVPQFRLVTINNEHGENSEIVTLIHEMGHMIGIVDHYYNGLPGDKSCLYGDYGYNADSLADITVCNVCCNRVADFIEQYKG